MNDLLTVLDVAERAGATRYFQTPAFGVVAATVITSPQPIRFTRAGFVTALYGQVQSGAFADYCGTTLRVQIGGSEDLFVDGQGGPAFCPMGALFGGNQNRQSLLRRVEPGSLWTFTVQNNTAGNVTPLAFVAFLDDEDIARALRLVQAAKAA